MELTVVWWAGHGVNSGVVGGHGVNSGVVGGAWS